MKAKGQKIKSPGKFESSPHIFEVVHLGPNEANPNQGDAEKRHGLGFRVQGPENPFRPPGLEFGVMVICWQLSIIEGVERVYCWGEEVQNLQKPLEIRQQHPP